MFIAGGKTLVMLMALIYSGRKFGTYITSDGQARLHSYMLTCTGIVYNKIIILKNKLKKLLATN